MRLKPFLVQDLGCSGAWHLDTSPRPVNQARRPASEPLLQTGQARLGAQGARCRGVAGEPPLQAGQARLGAQGSRCREVAGEPWLQSDKPTWG